MVAGKRPGAPTRPRQSAEAKLAAKAAKVAEREAAREVAKAEKDAAKAAKAAARTAAREAAKVVSPSFEEQNFAFHRLLGRYVPIDENEKAAVAARRNFAKEALKYGFKIGDFKLARSLRTPSGQAAARAEVDRVARISRFMMLPLGTQLSMLDDIVDRTPAIDLARSQGVAAAYEGMKCEPSAHGFLENTPQGQAWIEGYHEGQATVIRGGIRAPEPKAEEPPPGVSREEWAAQMQQMTADADQKIREQSLRMGSATDSLQPAGRTH